ncbi:putative ser/thr protein phosphatase 2A regulatory subunit A [Syncephalis fuscata]|nr:putative ser/thr protein phosphatase 2A regulatory subunit A [Syncephalis fuscata]
MDVQPLVNATSDEQALYPIAVLMDELKHDDVANRLRAIRRLDTIALALGPERTRDELVPFLQESMDDEDEVLVALAEELGGFTQYIGGREHVHILLEPLEKLAAQEETVVRDKAVISLTQVADAMNQQQIESSFVPLLKRLTDGDWFTNRTSACGLYASAYKLSGPATQEELRRMFSELCHDETPMVRRAAATHLATLTRNMAKELVIPSILPLFNHLAQDNQDSVRLLTVEALIAIAQALSPEECKQQLNRSCRICAQMLAKAVGSDITHTELVTIYVSLLRDNESEVRSAAASQIPGFGELVGKEVVLDRIMVNLKDMVSDTSQHVRASLASQISGLTPIVGKEDTIEHLLPLFLRLLKDEFPDVRLNIISKMEQVNQVIGVELLSQSLLPAIIELAEDKQWRVRLAIIEYIPLLAGQLGVVFFNEKLGDLCMSWLTDSVFSIREAATVNLRRLTEVFGVEWATQTIIPKVLAMASDPNYLHRMTTIFAITAISPALTPEVIRDHVLPTVTTLAADPIPNIRFNVAKSIALLAPLLREDPSTAPLIDSEMKPALLRLNEDQDNDVKYFAHRALLACK